MQSPPRAPPQSPPPSPPRSSERQALAELEVGCKLASASVSYSQLQSLVHNSSAALRGQRLRQAQVLWQQPAVRSLVPPVTSGAARDSLFRPDSPHFLRLICQ
jgi:hypothetical protein